MKCGSCKQEHPTVADVRACYEHKYGQDETIVVTEFATNEPADPFKGTEYANDRQASPPAHYGKGGRPLPFPPGRYAILVQGPDGEKVTKFYKVDAPTEGSWAGHVFVKVQASDDLHPVRNREERTRIIDEISKDARQAMLRYGRELGKCGHCGRTLTDEESRAYGIGPVCRSKVRFVDYERAAR